MPASTAAPSAPRTQSADDYYGLGADGSGFQLLGLGLPAAAETGVHRDARPQGPAHHGRTEKRLLNSLRTEAGVFSGVLLLPVGEGVARNILDPATHLLFSNKLEDNAPIDELRPGACPSTRRSASCCA